ncbi:MAG: DUF4221 domain-containing protein [Tannerellaceae bacterium]|nr:DUF4221 domain-containing protein [Tannerellaceae bacterium]
MKKHAYYLWIILLLAACTDSRKEVKNRYYGKLIETKQLISSGEKRFFLDTETKAKPPYIQVFTDKEGDRLLTFLNPRTNSIYFYNYSDTTCIKRIVFEREGANAVLSAAAYYIYSPDSIYLFNRPGMEIVLANSAGQVCNRLTLMDINDKEWGMHNPQYMFSTVVPLMMRGSSLLLPGMAPFPEILADRENFHFTACLNLKPDQVEYRHTYPEELFGEGYNWGGDLLQLPYPAATPDGNMVHSFPCSHDLYISDRNGDVIEKTYGGGNKVKTIRPIDHKPVNTPDELIYMCYMEQDLYAAILHDPFRKLYYRYCLHGIADATVTTPIDSKPLTIIVMDEDFQYLGETEIGTGREWNWTNSFVTEEGLNIERIGTSEEDDDYLTFGIFIPEDL